MANNPVDHYTEYESSFTNLCFHGVNKEGDPARFNAVMVDEAQAFTLHMSDVVVISYRVLAKCINRGKAPAELLAWLDKQPEEI